jgi:hypothetical protein
MPKLNQIIAIEKTVKADSYSTFTGLHQQVQKQALLSGIARTYQPKDDEGDRLPAESTKVQLSAEQVISSAANVLTAMFDIVATKDWANCTAKADVVIDGKAILEGVPVTYLLFIEKQLKDIHTFVSKMPVLDQSETWNYDAAIDAYATPPVQTVKTKKIPRNHVKAEATVQHPAQVDVWTEDVVVGHWTTVKYSGALPVARINTLLNRVATFQRAVTYAREQANMAEAEDKKVGKAVFDYLFGT